jgi:hypothetical protein
MVTDQVSLLRSVHFGDQAQSPYLTPEFLGWAVIMTLLSHSIAFIRPQSGDAEHVRF